MKQLGLVSMLNFQGAAYLFISFLVDVGFFWASEYISEW